MHTSIYARTHTHTHENILTNPNLSVSLCPQLPKPSSASSPSSGGVAQADFDDVLVARAWVRVALSTRDGLHSFVRLLLHARNRTLLASNYAPWALLRTPNHADQAFANALLVVHRLSVYHLARLGVESESEAKALRNLPSQWWPLPFASFKVG